jgi:hypothetical protein
VRFRPVLLGPMKWLAGVEINTSFNMLRRNGSENLRGCALFDVLDKKMKTGAR